MKTRQTRKFFAWQLDRKIQKYVSQKQISGYGIFVKLGDNFYAL
jgi:hypothetical protein